jgi:hypothetical protein
MHISAFELSAYKLVYFVVHTSYWRCKKNAEATHWRPIQINYLCNPLLGNFVISQEINTSISFTFFIYLELCRIRSSYLRRDADIGWLYPSILSMTSTKM